MRRGFDKQEAGTENRPDGIKRKWRAVVSAAGYGELSEALKGDFSQSIKAGEDGRSSLTSDWQERTMKAGVLGEKGARRCRRS